jgi:integrase
MASVWKRKQDRRDPNAAWQITYTDERGERRTVAGCPDHRATEEIARKLESDVALRRRGVVDAIAERIAEQGRVPIAEHVRAFMEYVKARKPSGHAKRYLQQVESRVHAFIRFGNIAYLPEVDADKVVAYVAAMQARGDSGYTINEHVGTLKQFTRWAACTNRLAKDPLAATRKADAGKLKKTRPRRALSADEISRLLNATLGRPEMELRTVRRGPNAGKPVAKVSDRALAEAEALGRERVLAYLLTFWTGLRRSELKALEWRDVRLDTLPARIELRGETTKAKRADSIALHAQITEALREAKPDSAKPTDRVLRTVPGMEVLRADLVHAGIPEKNEAGRVDLHAMRKSINTYLATHGVPQRLAQAHMRHTDPRPTAGAYTDETLLPVASAVAGLPPVPTKPSEPAEALRMTGTCDQRAAHAQRAEHTGVRTGASGCNGGRGGDVSERDSQVHEKTATCAAVHGGSQQRVMGLEPTTFTLAT